MADLARRPRRLRATPALRRLVAETRVQPAQLVLPVFVADGLAGPRPITSLPGVVQHTLDSVHTEAARAAGAGIGGLMLFGVPDPADKDATGSAATPPTGSGTGRSPRCAPRSATTWW